MRELAALVGQMNVNIVDSQECARVSSVGVGLPDFYDHVYEIFGATSNVISD